MLRGHGHGHGHGGGGRGRRYAGSFTFTFTFTYESSFVLEEFGVDAAGAVIFEFGDYGRHAAEFDFFDDAFAELFVAYDGADANLDAFTDLAVVGFAFDDAGTDGE